MIKSESKKDKILSDAKKEARQLLLDTKQEINDMLKQIEGLKKNSSNLNKEKININEHINKKISDTAVKNSNNSSESNINKINISDLKIGQTVYILSFKKEGTIYSISDNSIKVQIGIIKTNVDLSDIKLIDTKNANSKQSKGINLKLESTAKNMSTQIDVMGLTVDEAIYEIDKFLDTAYLNRFATVTILHGKGTGKLKQGIHQFLKSNKYVKNYRIGEYNEGQDGVTIVTLK